MFKKFFVLILLIFCSGSALAKTTEPFKASASILHDKPVESSAYYAGLGDKVLNYYEKLPDKTGQERFLNAAKYFYYQSNKIDISNADALVGRARIALFQDKIRDAKNNLFIALNFNENNPKVAYYLGEAFFQDGDFDDAINYYTHAYNHGYRLDYKTNLKLGICYEKLDDTKKAKYHYTNAIKAAPSQDIAKMRIQGLDAINVNFDNCNVFQKPDETVEEENPLSEDELKSLQTN